MITLPALDLYRILNNARLFASRDDTLPSICCINLEASPGKVLAMGTDRFRLGVSRAVVEDSTESWTAMLRLDHVDLLMRTLLPNKRRCAARMAKVALSPKGRRLTVRVNEEMLQVPTVKAEFPKWRHLLDTTKSYDLEKSDPVRAFNPEYLATFSKVDPGSGWARRAHHMAIFSGSASRPSLVTIGNDFTGLIMPIRLPGDGPMATLPDWINP